MNDLKLFRALSKNDFEYVREYVEEGGDINIVHPENLLSPLMFAALYDVNETYIFRFLLANGANPSYEFGKKSLLAYILSNPNASLALLKSLHDYSFRLSQDEVSLNLGPIVFHADVGVLAFFIDHKYIDPNKVFSNGKTLLDLQIKLNPLPSHINLLKSYIKES